MWTLGIVVFLWIFALTMVAVGVAWRYLEGRRKKQVANMLDQLKAETDFPQAAVLIEDVRGQQSAVDRLLAEMGLAKRIEQYVHQAGMNWSATGLLAMMAIAGVIGFLAGTRLNVLMFWYLSAPALSAVFALLPLFYVSMKRKNRLSSFEEQFPEALDFLARSMRAGHAFSVSVDMLGQESPEPLGGEFRTVFQEQNLGAPIEQALKGLAERVPLLDVRFFVSSVLLQRQTGGNLSEVLTRLAHVIRERFRLKGQVRAASAHGRITATVLTVLPVATVGGLMIMAPGYLPAMAADPDGKYLIVGSILLQILGYYWMRHIINIKV